MHIFYWLRVLLISFEALVLIAAFFIYIFFGLELDTFAVSISLDESFKSGFFFIPLAMLIWNFKQVKKLMQEDTETILILDDWEDCWRLKIHANAGCIYSIGFLLIWVIAFFVPSGLNGGVGFLLFVTSTIGLAVVALSLYAAEIRLKDIIATLKESKIS